MERTTMLNHPATKSSNLFKINKKKEYVLQHERHRLKSLNYTLYSFICSEYNKYKYGAVEFASPKKTPDSKEVSEKKYQYPIFTLQVHYYIR